MPEVCVMCCPSSGARALHAETATMRGATLGLLQGDDPGGVVTPAKGDHNGDGKGSQLLQYCSHDKKKNSGYS